MKHMFSLLCFCFRQNHDAEDLGIENAKNSRANSDAEQLDNVKSYVSVSSQTSYSHDSHDTNLKASSLEKMLYEKKINQNGTLRGNSSSSTESFQFENLSPFYKTLEWDNLSSITLETAPKLYSMKGQTRLCRVIDVYDGDTVDIIFSNNDEIQHHKLRLYGIDCPEMKPLKVLENRKEIIQSAIRARDFLKELVFDKIVCVFFFNEEKFGRLMGNIYLIESTNDTKRHGHKYVTYYQKSVNQLMIDKGYAKEYFGGKKY